jgi:GNAT superfamily N-acetyltransferase
MPAVVVRAATIEDWRVVRSVRLRALEDTPQAFGTTLEQDRQLNDVDWQLRVSPGNWVLALRGASPVGMAAGVVESGRPNGERHLMSMWVAEELRGQQVARRLVDAVASWALTMGAETLSLWVADGNDRARRFYERMGFAATGDRQPLPSHPSIWEERLIRGPGTAAERAHFDSD